MSSQAGLWTGFALKKVGCHTFAHWCLLFPYIQNQTAWQGNPLWAKRTHIILFCSFKVQTRGPLCYRCTVVKNHDIALLHSAQDTTAGLCEQLHRIIQCTSVPQRHKLGTVLHLYDPNKHGLHSEGSPLSYIISRRPELVSCSTYCWHFNQLILIKRRIEHRTRFHTNAAIFTRWMMPTVRICTEKSFKDVTKRRGSLLCLMWNMSCRFGKKWRRKISLLVSQVSPEMPTAAANWKSKTDR